MINKLHFCTVGKTTVGKEIGNLAECRISQNSNLPNLFQVEEFRGNNKAAAA